MSTLFIILIILASVVLGLIVLVQNPKGGGLAGNIAGFSNQFMGVKQTTDVLEKGTWIFAGVIAILCLFSTFFILGAKSTVPDKIKDVNANSVPVTNNTQVPNNTLQLPTTGGQQPDSPKK
jgi:preprotein translocase subunit SecG